MNLAVKQKNGSTRVEQTIERYCGLLSEVFKRASKYIDKAEKENVILFVSPDDKAKFKAELEEVIKGKEAAWGSIVQKADAMPGAGKQKDSQALDFARGYRGADNLRDKISDFLRDCAFNGQPIIRASKADAFYPKFFQACQLKDLQP